MKKQKSFLGITDMFESVYSKFGQFNNENEEQEMVEIIKNAHDEWKNAEQFFQSVTDPDLIDHAIYKVEAAKTRYMYLMKKAKEEGVKGEFY
ncbi:DUF2508 family protein [Serpentinicella sp. ANB-PHB4]|uniref:DUF2508 family protein n=1 Tax=Serpentinicella sp. ANB-PHB4 TaxID=3074076 RepID=UPI00285EE037|nr:DUF2508 family protein [Serpentinicella sp. ANB-PHB4]MDR5658885.1 DUF2508 family protein [Serpentinicella sp. ANB-PHB4]